MIVRDENGTFYELYPVNLVPQFTGYPEWHTPGEKTTESNSVELFKLLTKSLHCDELLDEHFWDNYSIRAGEDGDLHVYTKTDGLIYDERGSLWLALVDIGREIIPNWENRI